MKRKTKNNLKSRNLSLKDFECRKVTESKEFDWCYRKFTSRNWGYVVVIPFVPNVLKKIRGIEGYIIRCKRKGKEIHLQIVEKENIPQYELNSFARKNEKKKRRIGRVIHVIRIKR